MSATPGVWTPTTLASGPSPSSAAFRAAWARVVIVTFTTAPAAGATVSAGQFDVPVRFDIDFLELEESAILAGVVPNIPVVELLG